MAESGGCGMWAPHCLAPLAVGTGSGAQTLQLWFMGLVALQQVGSFWTRDRTYVPCIVRQIRNHWTTREVQV